MLTVSECERYLQRIHYAGGVTPSLGNLQQLMACHLKNVPWENVKIHRTGTVPDLSMDALYEKVVEQRQGGYCFELNKLFQELLDSLGYQTRLALGRSTDTPGRVDPINHRGLIVTIDGEDYSADVGYGGPMPPGPLPLRAGEHQVAGSAFVVGELEDGWRSIDRIDSRGELRGLMELSDFKVNEEDLEPLNLYCASVGSEFRDMLTVNVCTEDGHASLTGNKLTVIANGAKDVREVADEEVDGVLKETFGLSY